MSKPEYHVYRCDAENESPDTRDNLVTTKSIDEAKSFFEQQTMRDGLVGNKYVIEVSARGNTAVLESKTIEGTLAERAWSYGSANHSDISDEKAKFIDTICTLHEAGFSAGEIAEITGKTLRVIQYNLQKLKAAGKIKPHGPGRPLENTVRDKKPVLIQLYADSYDYLMDRFGNITNVVNDLIDKYRKELEESDES